MSDWFRNEDWSPEIEEQFFRKLGRARSQKAQYLRVQAYTLRKTRPEIALKLLETYFATGDTSFVALAYDDQAAAYTALGKFEWLGGFKSRRSAG